MPSRKLRLELADNVKQLVKDCLDGQSGAQEKLYRAFSAKMYALCLRYANNKDDASDILQDGFIKVFTKLHQFNHAGSLEGWIRRIIVNTALERFRRPVVEQRFTREIPDIPEDESTEMIMDIPESELLKFIQELSPQYRSVFNLYVIEEYSHKEIAEMMNISEGTSKSNLSRARLALQEKIARYMQTTAKAG